MDRGGRWIVALTGAVVALLVAVALLVERDDGRRRRVDHGPDEHERAHDRADRADRIDCDTVDRRAGEPVVAGQP